MQFKLAGEKKDSGEVKGPTMEKDFDFLTIDKEDVAGKTLFPGRAILGVSCVFALVAFTTVVFPTVLRVQPGLRTVIQPGPLTVDGGEHGAVSAVQEKKGRPSDQGRTLYNSLLIPGRIYKSHVCRWDETSDLVVPLQTFIKSLRTINRYSFSGANVKLSSCVAVVSDITRHCRAPGERRE
jgi:hypothetical protein